MAARTPQVQDKYILRLPLGMRDRLKSEAQDNGRSLNAEMVQRLSESLELNAEHEDLWRELQKRDAKIRQVEEDAYTRERLLKDLLSDYKQLIANQDAILQAICYRILQFKDAVPKDAFDMAEKLLSDRGVEGAARLSDDPQALLDRYFAAVRSAVSIPSDKKALSTSPKAEQVRERVSRQAERAASKRNPAA